MHSIFSAVFVSTYWNFDWVSDSNMLSLHSVCTCQWAHISIKMFVLTPLVIFCFLFKLHESQFVENNIEDYIQTVSTYYSTRNVKIITHFSCFSQSKLKYFFIRIFPLKKLSFRCILLGENARISIALSKQKIQSRFMIEFDTIDQLVDTPNHTIQGFIVNMLCDDQIDLKFPDDDRRIIFRDSNLWLFVDNNIDSSVNETIVRFFNNKNMIIASTKIDQFKYFYRIIFDLNTIICTLSHWVICLSQNEYSKFQWNCYYLMHTKSIMILIWKSMKTGLFIQLQMVVLKLKELVI